MIATLQSERTGAIKQVATFVEASERVDFQPTDRVDTCECVTRTLARLGEGVLDKPHPTA